MDKHGLDCSKIEQLPATGGVTRLVEFATAVFEL
jgi:hypothetical protein